MNLGGEGSSSSGGSSSRKHALTEGVEGVVGEGVVGTNGIKNRSKRIRLLNLSNDINVNG